MNDIMHVKLVNGEDIVAFVSSLTESFLQVEYPVRMDRYKETGYQFSKWFPFSVDTKVHTIRADFVLGMSDLEDSVRQNYVMYALSEAKLDREANDQEPIPYPEEYDDIDSETELDPIIH